MHNEVVANSLKEDGLLTGSSFVVMVDHHWTGTGGELMERNGRHFATSRAAYLSITFFIFCTPSTQKINKVC